MCTQDIQSREVSKSDLGPELCRYSRRPQRAILRDQGFSHFFYLAPFFIVLWGLVLVIPLVFLADPARRPLLQDSFWGSVLACDFVINCGILAFVTYVWPRLMYLAIHEKGFVYRAYRCYNICFQDIDQCLVSPNSGGLTLVLKDARRLWFQNFMIQFPPEGIKQLIERINNGMDASRLAVTPVDTDLKGRFRRLGWIAALLIYAAGVLVPICCAECRAVLVKAFGKDVCGAPTTVVVPLLMAVLFAPFLYVLRQLMVLKSAQLPTSAGLYDAKELRRARIIVGVGLLYLFVLAGAWVAFKSAKGI